MVFGMTLVFLTLGAIMLVMVILDRIFQEKPDGGDAETAPVAEAAAATEPSAPVAAVQPTAEQALAPAEGAALAAAIAIAMSRAREETYTSSYLPGSLDDGENTRWDWLWDEGVDDYGVSRGSQYAAL